MKSKRTQMFENICINFLDILWRKEKALKAINDEYEFGFWELIAFHCAVQAGVYGD
jgi:hypothetical protein